MQMRPLDSAFPIQQQLALPVDGPVVLANLFTLDAADEAAFLAAWSDDALYEGARRLHLDAAAPGGRGKPGLSELRGVETLDTFRAAFGDAGFQAKLAQYPASAVASPHLFQRVAVPGICTA